jgi:hypothetical protein
MTPAVFFDLLAIAGVLLAWLVLCMAYVATDERQRRDALRLRHCSLCGRGVDWMNHCTKAGCPINAQRGAE